MESADTEDRKKSGELFKFKQQLVEKEGLPKCRTGHCLLLEARRRYGTNYISLQMRKDERKAEATRMAAGGREGSREEDQLSTDEKH